MDQRKSVWCFSSAACWGGNLTEAHLSASAVQVFFMSVCLCVCLCLRTCPFPHRRITQSSRPPDRTPWREAPQVDGPPCPRLGDFFYFLNFCSAGFILFASPLSFPTVFEINCSTTPPRVQHKNCREQSQVQNISSPMYRFTI